MRTHTNTLLAWMAAFVLVTAAGAAQAQITILNADGAGEGFNDPTPVTPVGGNPGVTLGQQRLNVFQHAADIWAARLNTGVAITVEATFDPLFCNGVQATLGAAGPLDAALNFAGAPMPNTWYVIAEANALVGADLNGATPEVLAQFTTSLDLGCIAGISGFYYGFDSSPAPGQLNLLPVVLHELAHGLGFAPLSDLATGALLLGFPDIFIKMLFDDAIGLSWDAMTDTQRMNSAVNTGHVVWTGQATRLAAGAYTMSGRDSEGRLLMYAPNPLQPGSSIAHWDTSASPDLLMEPFATLGLDDRLDVTAFSLRDMSWPVVAECNDGLDNDGDGLTDYPADPTCFNANWAERTECDDGWDNDGDGLTDHPADPTCTHPGWLLEFAECSDGVDNDGDGLVDYPADPGCAGITSLIENPQCDDGLDNDGDGLIDFPADPSCKDATKTSEVTPCSDTIDNDGDGLVDFPADPGCGAAHWPREDPACSDGIDNDSDGFIDLVDPQCGGPADQDESCGMGFEVIFALLPWAALRHRRRRACSAG